MDIKQALKTPYTSIGKLIILIILFFVGIAFSALGLLVKTAARFLPVPEAIVSPVQIIGLVVGVLFSTFFLGYISRILRSVTEGTFFLPSTSFFKSVITGVQIAIILFIYSIPYHFTLYIHGSIGTALTVAYIIIALAITPALFTHLSIRNPFTGSVAWPAIFRTIKTKEYWIAWAVSFLAVLPAYSLLNFALTLPLTIVRATATSTLNVALAGVTIFIYWIFLFLVFITWAALFGQIVNTAAKPAARNNGKTPGNK